MAATPYVLTASAAATIKDGATVMAVNANSEAEAEAIASAHINGDSNLRWTGPTAASLGTPPNDWVGWTMQVLVTKTGQTTKDFSYVGTSGQTFANLLTGLVAAINASSIDLAAFNTDTLTVAKGAGDDDFGDWTLQFKLTSPNGAQFGDLYVASYTHQGASTADLAVVLVADATLSRVTTPTVVGTYGN